jgi:hypothetical protein
MLRFWVILFFLLFSISAYSQRPVIPHSSEVLTKTFLEIALDGGVGFDQIPIFTTGTEDIFLSPGGGFNFALRFLYRMHKIEYSLGGGVAVSTLSRTISNADATFIRFVVDPQVKLILRLKNGNSLNPAGGFGIYPGGSMEIDASRLPRGTKDIFKYNTAVGFFLSGEYEWSKLDVMAFAVGLKYYNVRYDIRSVKVNSVSFSTAIVPYDFAVLDGSGIDLIIRIRIKL